jgi:hypothetical protein
MASATPAAHLPFRFVVSVQVDSARRCQQGLLAALGGAKTPNPGSRAGQLVRVPAMVLIEIPPAHITVVPIRPPNASVFTNATASKLGSNSTLSKMLPKEWNATAHNATARDATARNVPALNASVKLCEGWRQTAGCRADGPREPEADSSCAVRIFSERSGFCACAGGRQVSAVDCGHTALTCDEACRKPIRRARPRRMPAHLKDERVVSALSYTALMALGDRAAASALLKARAAAAMDTPSLPRSRRAAGLHRRRAALRGANASARAAHIDDSVANGSARIPLRLYQTIDRLDRAGLADAWRSSEGSGLQYVLHDDVLGQRYLNASWGPRFARAFGQLRLGPIRSDFLRLAYVAEHGGFYADADVCPQRAGFLSSLIAHGTYRVARRTRHSPPAP